MSFKSGAKGRGSDRQRRWGDAMHVGWGEPGGESTDGTKWANSTGKVMQI